MTRRRVVLVIFVAAGCVAAAIYFLRVTAIEVEGTTALSPSQVLAASGLRGGERILWLRTGEVASRIERYASVASADVDRKLPGTIVIRVSERAAVVALGRGLAADASGVVFAYPSVPASTPALEGWRAPARPGALLDDASRAVVSALGGFPPELRRRVRRISLVGSVTMFLDDGTEVRFGQPDDLVVKARAAQAVLVYAAEHHEVLAYVDVRAPSAPASRDRTPPSPSPTASAAPGP